MPLPATMVRHAALAEAVSYLLLLGIAMPLKYLAGQPLAVRLAGSVHGLLFIVLCWALWRVWTQSRWPWQRCALVLLISLLPFVPFFFDIRMRKWEAETGAGTVS